MWAALILVALAAGAAAGNSSCACSAGFPPLPAGGFKSISGYAGCIINYVQFEDATGAVVFTSGTLSGGEPFSVSCPGNNTITGFSYLCNAGSGPNGEFPTPTFASLSTLGGITCSNGSTPFYSGALDENVCELASGYTQLGFLDCGTDGSAPQSCFSEGGGCVQGSISHMPCSGTDVCSVVPPTPPPSNNTIVCDGKFTTVKLPYNFVCEGSGDPVYQPPQGPVQLGGVSFYLAAQSYGVAGNCSVVRDPISHITIDFNFECPNAISVHTIMNSYHGDVTPGINTLNITAGDGKVTSIDLLGNAVIRDSWLAYTSQISNPPTINVWRGLHTPYSGNSISVLDMQSFNITSRGLMRAVLIDNDIQNGYYNAIYAMTIESSV